MVESWTGAFQATKDESLLIKCKSLHKYKQLPCGHNHQMLDVVSLIQQITITGNQKIHLSRFGCSKKVGVFGIAQSNPILRCANRHQFANIEQCLDEQVYGSWLDTFREIRLGFGLSLDFLQELQSNNRLHLT